MSKLKLNITMSIDGFVAGPDQSAEHPLGVGGGISTTGWSRSRRSARATARKAAKSTRARRSPRTFSVAPARPSWAGTCSAAARDRGTSRGRAGGETIRRTTIPSSSSLAIRASRWSCGAERRSTSSRTGSSRRSNRRGRKPERRRCLSGAGRPLRSSTSQRVCSTRSSSRSSRSCWEAALGCSRLGDAKLEQVESVEAPGVTHIRYARA